MSIRKYLNKIREKNSIKTSKNFFLTTELQYVSEFISFEQLSRYNVIVVVDVVFFLCCRCCVVVAFIFTHLIRTVTFNFYSFYFKRLCNYFKE